MTQGINKDLLQYIFSGSYMKRWNDKLRPVEFIEVDKQAHKMIVAWLLCELNSSDLSREEALDLRLAVIERGLADYFLRLVITDIKPPVYYKIKANPKDYEQLADWALAALEPCLKGAGESFWNKLSDYVRHPVENDRAADILHAAHSYASYWEFKILRPLNGFDEEMEEIDRDFNEKLARHYGKLQGTRELMRQGGSPLGSFARLCGQLRFQKRWSQTSRIPETSVMGHMFIVACYSYFFSMHIGACKARTVNNFFCALFHDLPELLTRDIISPVKNSVDTLGDLIRSYENSELESRVFAPLSGEYANLVERLRYYLGLEAGSEFKETVMQDGKVVVTNFDGLQEKYNYDGFDPKDGSLLKTCDSLAAFVEAYSSIECGVDSRQLREGIKRIRSEYAGREFKGLKLSYILADFE